MLIETDAAASPAHAAGRGAFESTGSKPAVKATNTGKGEAVSAKSHGGATVSATQTSTASSAVAVHGAVTGTTATGTGVVGSAHNGTGVKGTSVDGNGVSGKSTVGIGVVGSSASTAAGAIAIQGTISSTSPGGDSAGVRGINNGTSGSGIGVYGSQAGFGWGVYGTSPSGYGVYGDSPSGDGVVGTSNSGSGVVGSTQTGASGVSATAVAGNGVFASSSSGSGVSASSVTGYGVYSSSPHNYAVVGVTTSGNGVYGQVSTAPQSGVVGRSLDASGNWGVYAFGNIGATGTKSAVVPAADGNGHVTLYCMESPECWFEDFGSGTLSAGTASVEIESVFAQTVETDTYHVFVQADGECQGLSVRNKTASGFEVRELSGGTSNVAFAYRIVALRKGVEAPRLNRTTLPVSPMAATA
jgi:hypothetical protein